MAIADEVGNELCLKSFATITGLDRCFSLIGNSLCLQFYFQRILIDFLCKATPKITMRRHSSTDNLVCFFTIYEVIHRR